MGKLSESRRTTPLPFTVDRRPTPYEKVVRILAECTSAVDRRPLTDSLWESCQNPGGQYTTVDSRPSTDSLLENCQNPGGHYTAVHRRPSTDSLWESCQNSGGEYPIVDRRQSTDFLLESVVDRARTVIARRFFFLVGVVALSLVARGALPTRHWRLPDRRGTLLHILESPSAKYPSFFEMLQAPREGQMA